MNPSRRTVPPSLPPPHLSLSLSPRGEATERYAARVHRVILAGPRSAPVTPPSSILFDYSVMGGKKSERSARGRGGGSGGTDETKGRHERWVVINGKAI